MSYQLSLDLILNRLRSVYLPQSKFGTYTIDLHNPNNVGGRTGKLLLTQSGYVEPIWYLKEMQYPYRSFNEMDHGKFNLKFDSDSTNPVLKAYHSIQRWISSLRIV